MGLFDTYKSPDEVQRSITQEGIQQDRAAPTGWGAINAAAAGGGRMLAQGLSGEDPRVSKAKAIQGIQQQMMSEGWESKANTPEFFQRAAELLAPIDAQQAMQAAMQGKELERKLKQDDLSTRNIESQITAREAPKDSRTTKQKDYENLLALGYPEEQVYKDVYGNKGTTVNVNTGQLAKPTINKLEESIINTTAGIDRLDNLLTDFKPEYFEIPTRAMTAAMDQYEQWGGELTPDQQKRVGEASAYYQSAIENVNLYIKYITGAQMSYQEADRLRLAVPDAGESIFGKDGPTKFKAKLINSIKSTKTARMRALYMRSHGLKVKEVKTTHNGETVDDVAFPISLSQMTDIYDKRGEALEKQFAKDNPSLKGDDLTNAVRTKLKEEFGM